MKEMRAEVCSCYKQKTRQKLFSEVWDEKEFETACSEAIKLKIEDERRSFLGSRDQIEMGERHLALRGLPS